MRGRASSYIGSLPLICKAARSAGGADSPRERGHVDVDRRIDFDDRSEAERPQVVLVPELVVRALRVKVAAVAVDGARAVAREGDLAWAHAADLDERAGQRLQLGPGVRVERAVE